MFHCTIKKTTDTGLNHCCIAFVLITLTLAGCSTAGIEGSASAVSRQKGQTVVNNQVIINNNYLATNLQITDLKADFVGNLLIAHVALLNKNNDTINFQYRFS